MRAINPRFHFTCPALGGLCKPHTANSLAHSSIGTPSPLARLRLFVSTWFQILFHLPYRDAFHLSLTVLVHYRSHTIFSLGSVVLPSSNGISPVPPYLSQT